MNNCPFCALAAGEGNNLLALRTPGVFVVPALKQRRHNLGHMLVLPTTHVTRMIDLEPSLVQELYPTAGRVMMAVRQAFGATGATLFQNDEAPDQELLHLHIHVVPRRAGDDFKLPDPLIAELSRQERQDQALAVRKALTSLL
jgi:histidine triad (HIT) family protein